MTTVKTKVFVVGGMAKGYAKDIREFHFIAHDEPSGGYPYASTSVFRAATTKDLNQAVRWLGEDSKMSGIENPKVYEILLEEVHMKEVETVHIEKHYERV